MRFIKNKEMKNMSETIYLCCGRAKCPEIIFSENGSMAISEFGETVYLSKAEVKELLEKLKERY